MSGAAHCVPSAPLPFSLSAGSMVANVSGESTSVIGYRIPDSAESLKLLSFRMSGMSLAWIRACTLSVKPSHASICSSTFTFGYFALKPEMIFSQSAFDESL